MYQMQDLVVRINWCFQKMTSSNWSDIRNNTTLHSFYWIHEGSGVFHTDQTYQVEPGMLFYMEPGLRMRMASSTESPLLMSMVLFECCAVHFSTGQWQMPAAVPRLDLPFVKKFNGDIALKLDSTFRDVTHTWVPTNPDSELESSTILLRLIAKLHQQEQAPVQEEQAFERYARIKKEIENHFAEPLHIEQMAREHAISVSYLRKLFLKHIHLPPKDYLTAIRMQHAERYLTYTNHTLRVIAHACGYSDEFHFSKAFRKWKGVAPTEFRNGVAQVLGKC
ncbi:hypothetical protein GCM10008915_72980 [Bifidobacterium pullorum subsp. gallinarum]